MNPTKFILFFIVFTIGNALATTIIKPTPFYKERDPSITDSYFHQLNTEDVTQHFGSTSKPFHETTPSAFDKTLAEVFKNSKAAKKIKERKELKAFGILDCFQCKHRVISDEWGDNQKNSGDQIQCLNCDKPVTIDKILATRKLAEQLFEKVNPGISIEQLYETFSALCSNHLVLESSAKARKIAAKAAGLPYR